MITHFLRNVKAVLSDFEEKCGETRKWNYSVSVLRVAINNI